MADSPRQEATQPPTRAPHPSLIQSQPTWKDHHMNHTQPVPCCPQCGRPVYRSHTCRVSRMPELPERHLAAVPAAPQLQLVTRPSDFRDRMAHTTTDPACRHHIVPVWPDELERAEEARGQVCPICCPSPVPDYDDVPDAYWPPLAQVEEPDLEWGMDGRRHEDWS